MLLYTPARPKIEFQHRIKTRTRPPDKELLQLIADFFSIISAVYARWSLLKATLEEWKRLHLGDTRVLDA
jgi:hypothetical protein